MHNLRAFSECDVSGSTAPTSANVFIPAEKDSEIIVTNLMMISGASGGGAPGGVDVYRVSKEEQYSAAWIKRLANPANAGTNQIVVDSLWGIGVGSKLHIASNRNVIAQEANDIAAIVGHTITLTQNLSFSYPAGTRVRRMLNDLAIPLDDTHPTLATPMVSIRGENLFNSAIDCPIELVVYGISNKLTVSGYWKDSV